MNKLETECFIQNSQFISVLFIKTRVTYISDPAFWNLPFNVMALVILVKNFIAVKSRTLKIGIFLVRFNVMYVK